MSYEGGTLGAYNLDMSIFRMIPIGGTRRLELRFEAGNILNHAVYGNPQGSITSGTYGQITGRQDPLRLQLGLTYTY